MTDVKPGRAKLDRGAIATNGAAVVVGVGTRAAASVAAAVAAVIMGRDAVRPNYLVVATVLFVVEVAIACGSIPGAFMRNSAGDVLVIPFLYFFLRGMTTSIPSVALGVSLAGGLTAELLQYLHLVDLLGLKHGSLLAIVLGSTFSGSDLLMYGIGGVLAVWLDVCVLQKRRTRHRAGGGHHR